MGTWIRVFGGSHTLAIAMSMGIPVLDIGQPLKGGNIVVPYGGGKNSKK